MTPDEQSLRADLGSARFLSGEDRGHWRFNQLQWPHLYVNVTAQDKREFVLRLDCSGFPASPPTGTFWDMALNNKLASEKWPSGGERIRLAFRHDWQNGNALYIPCDRISITGHPDWPAQYPQLIWKPSKGISHYLEVVYDLLQSKDYIHAAA